MRWDDPISKPRQRTERASGDPQAAGEHGNSRGEQRWERTLALVRSGKTIAEVATVLGRTEGTIVEHLESLRAIEKLTTRDIAHLAQGSEEIIAAIHSAFRALGTQKLSPIFQHFGGAYSHDTLRLARLLFSELITREIPPSSGFDTIRARHPHAYFPWDQGQDEQLRELFSQGSSVNSLAHTFNRTRGAIRSRLAKLGLVEKGGITGAAR